jgi:hypothetical protein
MASVAERSSQRWVPRDVLAGWLGFAKGPPDTTQLQRACRQQLTWAGEGVCQPCMNALQLQLPRAPLPAGLASACAAPLTTPHWKSRQRKAMRNCMIEIGHTCPECSVSLPHRGRELASGTGLEVPVPYAWRGALATGFSALPVAGALPWGLGSVQGHHTSNSGDRVTEDVRHKAIWYVF